MHRLLHDAADDALSEGDDDEEVEDGYRFDHGDVFFKEYPLGCTCIRVVMMIFRCFVIGKFHPVQLGLVKFFSS